jgi:hypothetical protein
MVVIGSSRKKESRQLFFFLDMISGDNPLVELFIEPEIFDSLLCAEGAKGSALLPFEKCYNCARKVPHEILKTNTPSFLNRKIL